MFKVQLAIFMCSLLSHCRSSWVTATVAGTMLQSGKSRFRDPMNVNTYIFSINLILPTAIGPGVHSASNRNEYQKQKNNVSGE
jgi:Mn2+/Fe2+ NRAMP family transporter